MFGRSWRVGSVRGIDIRIDSSLAIAALLVTYNIFLLLTSFPSTISTGPAVALASASALLFFGSVLGHELAHAGMARLRGIPVEGITLFLFGGATSARLEDRGALDEFLVTVVGPLTSASLGVAFWAATRAAPAGAVHDSLGYLAWVNLVLAVFNLVPGFPLDGGRIFRSIVWRVTGDLDRATRIAATLGVIVGGLLIGIGLLQFARRNTTGGIWLALIGWFLMQAARASMGQQRLRRVLSRGTAREAMGAPPPAIPSDISLAESLDRYLRGHETEAFPVVEGDRVVGVLTFDAARRLGMADPLRPVRDAMIGVDAAGTVEVDDSLARVAETLGDGRTIVLHAGRLAGSITAADISRWLRTGIP